MLGRGDVVVAGKAVDRVECAPVNGMEDMLSSSPDSEVAPIVALVLAVGNNVVPDALSDLTHLRLGVAEVLFLRIHQKPGFKTLESFVHTLRLISIVENLAFLGKPISGFL